MSIAQKWFLNNTQVIKGPLTIEEVIQYVKSSQVDLSQTYLWTRGLNEWIRADKWNPQENYIPEVIEPITQKPLIPIKPNNLNSIQQESGSQKVIPKKVFPIAESKLEDTEVTQPGHSMIALNPIKPDLDSTAIIDNIKKSVVEKYKIKYHDQALPDMTLDELLQFIVQKPDPEKMLVYDKKKSEWKDIYTIHEVSNKLGISRRKTPRVPILASFTGTSAGRHIEARIVTIGAGGFGLTDHFLLKLGDSTSGQISSPHFYTPIQVKAEVTYGGLDGYIGLKFIEINDEGSAMIADYVKRFETAPKNS